jgi:hypothetical protein
MIEVVEYNKSRVLVVVAGKGWPVAWPHAVKSTKQKTSTTNKTNKTK